MAEFVGYLSIERCSLRYPARNRTVWRKAMPARAMRALLAVFGTNTLAAAGTGAIPDDLPKFGAGSGHFQIEGGEGREERTVTVHYYRPDTFTNSSPVLMAIPGDRKSVV